MKGKHKLTVYNNRVRYEIELKRNITIISGDSGTGKTTLVNMIRRVREARVSNIKCISDVPVYALSLNWDIAEIEMDKYKNAILLIDEGASYIKTAYFASVVKHSSNYFVLITRTPLKMLPYSVREIYKLSSMKNSDSQQTFNFIEDLYVIESFNTQYQPKVIITEDSNSGYEFFRYVVKDSIHVVSAGGRDNIINIIMEYPEGTELLVIVDGAACGAAFSGILEVIQSKYSLSIIWCYESFEWLILNSNLFREPGITEIIRETWDYVESSEYYSWERYFTELLCKVSKNTA